MNNSNNNHISPKSSPSIHKYLRYLSPFLLIFLLVLVVTIFLSILIIVLFRVNFTFNNNSNSIFVPEGKVLKALNSYTFKDRFLERFHSDYIVLDENEYFDDLVINNDDDFYNIENNNIVKIVTSNSFVLDEEEMFHIPCEGTCKCYIENDNFERRSGGVGSLVYSSRYTSIAIVSVLSFAVAKFVDDHIDGCYDKAKEVLNVNGDGNDLLTCSMEENECEVNEETVTKGNEKTKKEGLREYICNGYCIFNRKITNHAAVERAMEFDCEGQWIGTSLVHLKKSELVAMENVKNKHNDVWEDTAEQKFLKLMLVPFCNSFNAEYAYISEEEDIVDFYRKIQPCVAEDKNPMPIVTAKSDKYVKNYFCERNPFEFEYIDQRGTPPAFEG